MDVSAAKQKSTAKIESKTSLKRCSSKRNGSGHHDHDENVRQVVNQRHAKNSNLVDFSLRAGKENDHYEKEADRVADSLIAAQRHSDTMSPLPVSENNNKGNTLKPNPTKTALNIQKLCSRCEEEVQLKPDDERDESERDYSDENAQRFSQDFLSIRHGGKPLQNSQLFEQHIGHDFSQVRIHTDDTAARISKQLGARAFTHGRDIVFGRGQYDPHSPQGQHLLAHELTHVIQQGRAPAYSPGPGAAQTPVKVEQQQHSPNMQAGLLDDAGALWDDGTDFIADTAVSAGNAVVSGARAVGGAVVSGAEYVGGLAVDAFDSVRDFVISYLEEYAPGLLRFLRGDIIGTIKEKITDGLDYLFNGFGTRIKEEGLVGALTAVFGELTGTVKQIAADMANGNCESLFSAVDSIAGFGERLLGPAFDDLRKMLGKAGSFFGDLWSQFGAPAWDAIKKMAGDAWKWVSDQAKWLWDQTAGLRSMASYIWEEYKRIFDLEWNAGEGSVTRWLKDKATEAWDEIKEALGPMLVPLQVAGAIFLLFTPMAPFVVFGVGLPMLWQAISWLRENWDSLEIVITAREILSEQIMPALKTGLAAIQGMLSVAAQWLRDQFGQITAAINSLVATLAAIPIFRALFTIVARISAEVNAALTWLSTEFAILLDDLKALAKAYLKIIQPLAFLLIAIINFPVMPWMLVMILTGWAWRILPDCLKPAIIDFWIEVAIGFVMEMPEFEMFGPAWPQAKDKIIETLQELSSKDTDTKIQGSNRIAKMMTGEDFSWIANLAKAAWQMPSHFTGQMEEELLGQDLSQPLPIERTPEDILSADGGQQIDAAATLLGKPQLSDGDVEVDPVAFTQFSPELIEELNIPDGGEVSLGEGMSQDIASPEGMLSEINAQDEQDSGGMEVGATMDSPMVEAIPQDPEAQLEHLANQPIEMECGNNTKTEEPATQEQVPPVARRYGPFTPMQRFRYLMSQMGKGVGHWFDCNKHWVVPTMIVAIIALIAAIIFTEGAILGVLASAMEIVAAVLIGVSLVRMTAYLAEYVAKGIAGQISDSSKALARGLAIGAIELVFALLFSLGPIVKSAKAGFKAARSAGKGVMAATGAGARSATRATGQAARSAFVPSFEATAKVGGALSRSASVGGKNVRRVGGAIIDQGRVVMNGVQDGFAAGVRNVRDLRRSLSRLRFNGFSMSRRGRIFMVWGHFNPKALLASGYIVDASTAKGVAPTTGARAVSKSGLDGILIGVNNKSLSAFVRTVQEMPMAQRRALFAQLDSMDDVARRAYITGLSATADNARALRSSMNGMDATRRAARGWPPASGDAAHHMVASTHGYSSAVDARKILDDVGIGINNGTNGVFIPPAIHAPLHTHRYMDEVLSRLQPVMSLPRSQRRAAAQAVLDQAAADIIAGSFPH